MQPNNAILDFWKALIAFANNVFAPKLHMLFAVFWSMSLLGNYVAVSSGTTDAHAVWKFGLSTLLIAVSFFLVLFYLRMVDEIKDFEYDKIYNTDRPLVAKLISCPQLYAWMVLFFFTVLLVNYAIHPALAVILAVDMAYGLFLIQLEKWSKKVQDGIFINLAVTYPVNVTLSIYTLVYCWLHYQLNFSFTQFLLLISYATAFLHFEIARKSGWPHLTPPSERLYSHEIGPMGALALSVGLGLFAVILLITLFSPWHQTGALAFIGWLPVLAWIPMTIGSVQFLQHKQIRHKPRPMAVGYLIVFYATSLVHALAATHWEFIGW